MHVTIKISIFVLLYIRLSNQHLLPLVINTWGFTGATDAAYKAIESTTPVKAVIAGCSYCERHQCDGTVGFGGSPDEDGRTALDAMIMDGKTHDAGAVGNLQDIRDAIAVAEAVMLHTKHTFLVGQLATEFAVSMGFKRQSLQTPSSKQVWQKWQHHKCQPNYWMHVEPDSTTTCGPYKAPTDVASSRHHSSSSSSSSPADDDTAANQPRSTAYWSRYNHDTIGQLVIDAARDVAVGTSTNGARFKIPGRVGDSPIIGSGAYCDNEVGGAAATGDGDVMMRFLPSYLAVEMMRMGHAPANATRAAIDRITRYYPQFQGAVIAATIDGQYGAACHGLGVFPYSVRNPTMSQTNVFQVKCT